MTTGELDRRCHDFMLERGATPAPLNYRGYPKPTCISVNHEVCHGIPGERRLQEGDILNIDVTVVVDGWYGDTSRMFFAGTPPLKARRLCQVTFEALWCGIRAVRPGATLGDVGNAIQAHAERHRCSVVRDYCGHGIGRVFHDAPSVLHFGNPGEGLVLQPGMIFTIEPMVNAGTWQVKLKRDGWTVITRDRQLRRSSSIPSASPRTAAKCSPSHRRASTTRHGDPAKARCCNFRVTALATGAILPLQGRRRQYDATHCLLRRHLERSRRRHPHRSHPQGGPSRPPRP